MNNFVQPDEIKKYKEFFPKLLNYKLLVFFSGILKRLARVVGYPIGIMLPPDVAKFAGNEKALKALRILGRLREIGIIKSFSFKTYDYGDEPNAYVTLVRIAAASRTGMGGKGVHIDNEAETLWPALGEAVERHSMEKPYIRQDECLVSSYRNIHQDKVDLFRVAGFDDKNRESSGRNYDLKYDEDTIFTWTEAVSLSNKKTVLAPLQWFSFSHTQRYVFIPRESKTKREPLLSPAITTGAAAGTSVEEAVFKGLLEVIERDAFMIYWLNQIPAKKINPKTFNEERFDKLIEIAKDYRLEIHLLHLQTDMPVYTFCAIAIDRSGIGPALIIDARSDISASDTAYRVFSSVISQRAHYREMMELRKEDLPKLDEVKKIKHSTRMHLWFQKEQLPLIDKFLSGETISASSLPQHELSNNLTKNLEKLVEFITVEKGYEAFYKETISPELKNVTEGLSVVMVKIPQMQPLYLEEEMRCIGGERLRKIPKFLGYEIDESLEDPFSKVPHPFP